MDIDQRFQAERLRRQIAEMETAERRANHQRQLAKVRAEFATPARTIHVDSVIGQEPGEISARWFRQQLPADGSPIVCKFHSEGGSVFEAFALYDQIEGYRGPKRAVVESMAFSAASMLLCAFDVVDITPNGYVMVHSPHMDDKDLSRSERELLENLRARMVAIYAKKTGKPTSVIDRLIDQETFFDAEASIGLGIANRIAPASSAAVARLPQRVLAKLQSSKLSAKAQWQAAVDATAATMSRSKAITTVDKTHPGLRQKMIAEANGR